MPIEVETIVKVIKEAKYHPFLIGETVVIWRTCVDGYKVIQKGELPEDGNPEWWYVEKDDVEVLK